MNKGILIGLSAAVLLVSGCGYNRIGAPVPKKTKPVASKSVEAPVLVMKDAFGAAKAFATATYGDDFRPVMAFGAKVFDTQGAPAVGTWQFNMVGHKRGETGYTFVKIKVGTDGQAFVDPKTGGPFPDRNNYNKLPELDLDTNLTPEAGMQIVLTEGYGKKYAPQTLVSWEVRPSDRLKQTVQTFKWNHTTGDGTKWMVDCSIDPKTGEIIENGAYKY